jgi:hypothetical protein
MQADPESDAAFLRDLLVHGGNSFLDSECTLERVDCAGELSQDAVPRSVGNTPPVLCNQPVGNFPMGVQEPQRAGLVCIHQARIAGHVSA